MSVSTPYCSWGTTSVSSPESGRVVTCSGSSARLVTDNGRILAGSHDPYDDAGELALNYQARNRARGRMGGVERLRVRYRQYATPWYDVLFASRDEVAYLAAGTGWVARRFIDDGAGYVALLELE